jgi:hypothetical protein
VSASNQGRSYCKLTDSRCLTSKGSIQFAVAAWDGAVVLATCAGSVATENLIVEADGQSVRSLRHLVEIIESREAGLLVLETQNGEQIVLDRAREARRPPILAQYQVPSDRSEDLIAGGKVQRYADGSRRPERDRVQRALPMRDGSAGRLVDAGSRP